MALNDKVISSLNQASRHEDKWGSEGVTPGILNLGNRWIRVANFKPRQI
jgi:hypothetical protein